MGRHNPAFEAICEAARAQVTEIDVETLRQQKGQWRLIDVREDNEWQAGHIAGAEHLGRGILERDIDKRYPSVDEPLVLYCGGGYRSALAAVNLQEMGYCNVRSLAGGIRRWRETS
jgi:rhodanese-related sulfurtransferase